MAEKETAKEAWEILKMMNKGVECEKDVKVQILKSELKVIYMKEPKYVDILLSN